MAASTTTATNGRPAPLTDGQYFLPLALITSLFFLWAFGVNLNDVLIPHLKKAFRLTDFQSSFIQVAFFGGYFLAALPAGRMMERIGYKKGILSGLMLCAAGALLIIPAATVRVYGFFLFALFVMACGQSFLEVAANPYVTLLGPAESSERRLNLAQSFNAVGAVVTPIVGAAFILTLTHYSPAQLSAMSAEQFQAYQIVEADTVKTPYLVIGGLFLAVAALIYFSKLPDITEREKQAGSTTKELRGILNYGHLLKGVLAQFFYVGAQVGVASFVIRFAQHIATGTPEKVAANYLKLHLLAFMIGRFAGSAIMRRIPAPRLLSLFAAGALLCGFLAVITSGVMPLWAIVIIGFFHSIMFPTIFALSLKNLGSYTKLGSSLLVMSIIGGAIVPAIMGRISDLSSIQRAFFVPFICYAYVLYFALRGYKPHRAATWNEASTVTIEAK
ncbi:MAG: L-fucose:H+ symporter permease [Acidobacteria bacterium]|nr:MAG: L-fucose:H+ symporter permease [Acidobacteriota bacterium]